MTESIPLDTGHGHMNYLKENSLVSNTFKPNFYNNFREFIIPAKNFSMNNKQKSNENCSCKMIENTKEFEINFWDLSEKIRFTEGSKYGKLKFIVNKYLNSKTKEVKHVVKKPKKVLVLGSGSLKIGEAGETF